MSTLCGEPIGRRPGRTTPTVTAVLSMIAVSLWLVVIPLEFIWHASVA